MKTFEDIRSQIELLPRQEYLKLMHWLRQRDDQAWDEALDRDAEGGRLDFLIEEALNEKQAGQLREL